LLTLPGVSEHPSSMISTAVALAVGAVVAVPVAEEVKAARLDAAALARWASMPVAAANPMTVAESRAMMQDRTKTRRLMPHIVLAAGDFGWEGGSATARTCALKGEATVWPP
jgi:hypothetical protein